MVRTHLRLGILVLLACALTPARASAHPADMYTQDQSLQFTRSGLQLDWKILPGPFLADAVWAAADTDGNGSISPAEAQAWVAPFVHEFSLSLDSQRVPGLRLQNVRWPTAVDALRTGEEAVEITLQLSWPAAMTGQHALEVHNTHLESNSLNWFSLAAQDGLCFSRPTQDNGRLIFDLFVPSGSHAPAKSLTAWTSGTPNLPDFASPVSRLASSLNNSGASSGLPFSIGLFLNGGGAASALTGLVRNAQASPLFLITALLLSLALGSLHALTPGHGKALVGAYLVGSRGRVRDAVLLGGVVTLTHTGSVLALGLITLLASHYILPVLIVPWLELISGLLVVAFGVNLLVQRRRDLRSPHDARAHHGHVHPHQENFASRPQTRQRLPLSVTSVRLRIPNQHDYAPVHPSANPQSAIRNHKSKIPSASLTFRSLIALGVSGGLVPCPDAIAILLVAVALNRVPFGMLLIVSFSLGLAAVLIGIGIAMVRGVAAIQASPLGSRSGWPVRVGAYAPVVSAVVVCVLGAGLSINAWNSFQFFSAPSSPNAAAASLNINVVAHAAGDLRGQSAPGTAARRLLYIASDASGNDQLFLLPAPGGSPVQYTQEPNGVTGYSVSPHGTTILYSVFKTDGGSALWAIHADGSGRRLALDCPQAECNSPAWFPDGTRVAYERLENTPDSTNIPRFSIWWLDPASGKTQPVFQDAAFASTAPQFSPDGHWLSYISAASNTMVVYNLDNARTLSVPLGSQAAIPEAWSPHGDALLFGTAGGDTAAQALHVKTYSLASGRVTDLGGRHGETDFTACWSPDGTWIAIDRNVPSPDASASSNQVWLVRPDGTQAHMLLDEAGASYSGLSWSSDGRVLVYSRYTLDVSAQTAGRFDVASTDIATGQSTLLVSGGDLARFLP